MTPHPDAVRTFTPHPDAVRNYRGPFNAVAITFALYGAAGLLALLIWSFR